MLATDSPAARRCESLKRSWAIWNQALACEKVGPLSCWCGPVSYTHLDVYKRQALVGAWANRQRPSAGFWACAALGIEGPHVLITLSALVIGWSVLIMLYNLVFSQRMQPVADRNPWRSRAPEWQIASPPPEFNYDVPFEVVGEPYDYGLADTTYIRDVTPVVVPSGD